jgi:hypothetical protein
MHLTLPVGWSSRYSVSVVTDLSSISTTRSAAVPTMAASEQIVVRRERRPLFGRDNLAQLRKARLNFRERVIAHVSNPDHVILQ